MVIKQLSIFVENKMGRLAEIAKLIGDAGIDLRALSVADTNDFGILRLIVDKPDDAIKVLRTAKLTVSLTDVVAVAIDDVPGSFAKVLEILAKYQINIEYMYAFLSREEGQAYVILRVEDSDATIQVLQESGIHVLQDFEVYTM
jgi:ACT domain-containing protein